MDKNNLINLGISLEIASVFIFFVALIVLIFSKKYRVKALKTMVICVIAYVIGYGICASNVTTWGGFH